MKKILIATWFTGQNYGTLLQAYCLKNIIENIENENYEVYILNYLKYEKNSLCDKIYDFYKLRFNEKINKINYKLFNKILTKFYQIRDNSFNKFRNENLNLYPNIVVSNSEELKKINIFDIYVVGSDQVWNPKLLDSVYLLNWVDNSKIKFSYAPSVCVEDLSEIELKNYSYLINFDNISVRENTKVVKQLEKISKKKIEVVLDPVLLFGREKMLDLCKNGTKDNNEKKEYVLSYIIGKSKSSREFAINYSRSNKIKLKSIVAVNPTHSVSDIKLLKNSIWDIDPIQLINYIFNSEIVITDSFHVMVICLLLHKDFIILERENDSSQQNNRLIELLKIVNLTRKLNQKSFDRNLYHISIEEWNIIDKKLNDLRKKSYNYLIRSLKGGKNNEEI